MVVAGDVADAALRDRPRRSRCIRNRWRLRPAASARTRIARDFQVLLRAPPRRSSSAACRPALPAAPAGRTAAATTFSGTLPGRKPVHLDGAREMLQARLSTSWFDLRQRHGDAQAPLERAQMFPRFACIELLFLDMFVIRFWCERRDSNPHAFRRQNLNLVRLPIPPLSPCSQCTSATHYAAHPSQPVDCNIIATLIDTATELAICMKFCSKLLFKSDAFATRMAVDHYENFPVASVLLPARLRRPVALIYRFAREADDFADEGDCRAGERLAQLDSFRRELRSHRSRRSRPASRGSRELAGDHPRARPAAQPVPRPAVGVFAGRHSRRATRTTPKCSTTAAARPTRSGACCCVSTARPTPQNTRVVGRHLLEPAAHQFLAGRRDRLPQGPHLPAAGRNGAIRHHRRRRSRRGDTDGSWREFMSFQVERARATAAFRRAAGARAARAASASRCA